MKYVKTTSLYSYVQIFSQSNACRIPVGIHSLRRETCEPKELPVKAGCVKESQPVGKQAVRTVQKQAFLSNYSCTDY